MVRVIVPLAIVLAALIGFVVYTVSNNRMTRMKVLKKENRQLATSLYRAEALIRTIERGLRDNEMVFGPDPKTAPLFALVNDHIANKEIDQ